ncbi:oligosaccharide flippase family protein [Neobacillus sp. PS3-34]|uniref:oligosaccharide flippase family protein n=1 Tax=Neobacillus sp. PS3-34 TaxID=3070678 RepID=UPI0027E20F1C|nr:oligosaccharide flippase family protein [Neobacillus sp. PS3-34]WML48219.1 oligosaccharide flippase family protein [Neobacillus sp. PS3-34]
MNSFFRGTIILIVAAFFSECAEFFVNMILARELREEGMGIYMSILPIIFLIFVIASLELPISISKFIAENKKSFHYNFLQHAVKLAALVMFIMLIVTISVLSYPSIMDRFHLNVKWLLAGLIPISSFSSIARGYFMGIQQMGKIAFSNFLRKAFQLGVLLVVFDILKVDKDSSLLMALSALIGSELIVFLYLISLLILHMQKMKNSSNAILTGKHARQKLLSVSLPTVGVRIFHAITNSIQPFLIQSALMAAGFSSIAATKHFGMLSGVAMTIGFFPAFIAHSLMVMLIPNVSDAFAKHDYEKLRNLFLQSMWITMIYGIPAVLCMNFFAEQITSLFFSSMSAALYLKLMWPYFLFHFFVIPMQAYLIGLGLVKDMFLHTIWSHIISFSVMYFLGSQFSLNIVGIILGLNTGAVLLFMLHYLTICKKIGITLWLTNYKEA